MGHYASNCLTSNDQLPKFKQMSQQSVQYAEDQYYQDDENEYVF
jgi:hypothetical protein